MNNFGNFNPCFSTQPLVCMFEEVKTSLFILFLLFYIPLFSQDTATIKRPLPGFPSPSQFVSRPNQKLRAWLAGGASVAGYGGSIAGLSSVWYSKYPHTNFHFFNDNEDWLQVDKAGHFFSAYTAAKFTAEAWRWAGVTRKQRIWIGGLSGTAFLTVIEVLDGFSSEWGFSVGDMGANLLGSGTFIAQELAWDEQRVQVKFSFHRNNYPDASLNQRANELFGRRTSQRMMKDYNAQTYWASANIRSFFPQSRVPGWLNIAIGYGAEGMFGGTVNVLKDGNGNIVFDRRDIARYRQFYIAPDVDLTRIKTKSRMLKTAFFLLNSLKFPAPSIGFSRRGIECNWLHF